MRSSLFWRTRILLFFIMLFSFILLFKLFLVQVVHNSSYSERADRQYATPAENIFERGTIFFTSKADQLVSAAMQISGYKLAVDPSKLSDWEDAHQKLSVIREINKDDFASKAAKKNDPYEEIANHLSKEEADAVSALKIPGVNIFKEKWRFYPGDNLASHALGFVGYKGDELSGRYGLERQYNTTLSRNKNNPYVNFFAEVFSNINEVLFEEESREGNVITTIEPSVQSLLEEKLKETGEKYQTDSIGGIIMNPKNGSIYALGVKPDFNLNTFSKVEKISIFSNPLVENVLEFGSVVKPLVMAAALNEGVIAPETKYEDRGSVWVEKKEIFNFDKKARGVVNMQEVLNQSLNTGMVFVYQKLGKKNLKDYLLSYGIKDKTGIDLPPVGMLRALASLSNGGKLVVPHLVREIRYADGTSKKIEYETLPTKISTETSAKITEMLVGVMDKAIKGGTERFERFSVAVKTGTAQVANAEAGGYYKDRHTHSFFGYFPAYDPEFIVFLYAVNPKGVEYAATTWADPFLDITKFLLNYYEVPPDR